MDQETQKRASELNSEIDALQSAIERIEEKKCVLIVTKGDKIAVPFWIGQHQGFVETFTDILRLELNRLQAELEAL